MSLFVLSSDEAVYEYHAQKRAISKHFCHALDALLPAVIMCREPAVCATLADPCIASTNVVFLWDYKTISNTGSNCSVVIRPKIAWGPLWNEYKIITCLFSRHMS